MRILQVKIENDQYDRLVTRASEAGVEPGDLVRDVLGEWLQSKDRESRESEWKDRMRYVKLRIRGQELQQISDGILIMAGLP